MDLPLRPEVASYGRGQYRLLGDLENLSRVQRAGAPEAVIFYCGRVLETLACDALEQVGLRPATATLTNLDTLDKLNLLPPATRYWAHGLRRLGNAVRHVLRPCPPAEAEQAVVFAERWLDWYFCRFALGSKLNGLTISGTPLRLNACDDLRNFALECDAANFDPAAAAIKLRGSTQMMTATIAALLAEMLLDRQADDQVRQTIEDGLSRFGDDLRLRQLHGLYFSRVGQFDEARKILEPLQKQFSGDDETTGILAGVYKRLWAANHSQEFLEKSRRAYATGWERSQHHNAYLGINAATTALFLDRAEESKQIAGEIATLLTERFAALSAQKISPPLAPGYWDQVTLAEALLLQSNLPAAKSRYAQAFAAYPRQIEGIRVAKDQAKLIVAKLGKEFSVD